MDHVHQYMKGTFSKIKQAMPTAFPRSGVPLYRRHLPLNVSPAAWNMTPEVILPLCLLYGRSAKISRYSELTPIACVTIGYPVIYSWEVQLLPVCKQLVH
jgi:hypothetical protein